MHPALALIITNVIWGAAAPIFKYSLTDIPPFLLLFIRFFFASFLFLPFIRSYHFEGLSDRDWRRIIISIILAFNINIGLFFLALQKTESINAPVIQSTIPIILLVASALFLKEKIRPRQILGTVISFVGIIVIVFSPLLTAGDGFSKLAAFSVQIEGNLLYLLAALAYAASILIIKPVMKKVPALVMTYLSFVVCSAFFFPFAAIEMTSWNISQLSLPGIVGIVFGTFFSSAIAYYLYYYGLSKIAAAEVGLFAYTDPVAAILVAAPLLGEYPDWTFLAGTIFVFGGIFISEGRLHYHPLHRLRHKFV